MCKTIIVKDCNILVCEDDGTPVSYLEICSLTSEVVTFKDCNGKPVRCNVEEVTNVTDFVEFFADFMTNCQIGGGGDTSEPPTEGKTYSHEIVRYEGKKAVPIAVYTDNITGMPCYYLANDKELINELSNTELIMSNVVGMPQDVAANVTPEKTFEWCSPDGLEGTIQDILDAALLDPNWLLPDGTAPTGLLHYELDAEYKGSMTAGKKTLAQGFSIGDPATSTGVSFDGGQGICETANFIDADCDNLADVCLDLTKPVSIPPNSGVVIKLIGAKCDDDPTVTAGAVKG